jgi:hypothetical protein
MVQLAESLITESLQVASWLEVARANHQDQELLFGSASRQFYLLPVSDQLV